MNGNKFFESKGPFSISEIFLEIKFQESIKIFDIKTLDQASISDLTFFDSLVYLEQAKKTKAKFCLTTEKLKDYLPSSCCPIVVKNVLYELCNVTKKFYPDADVDFQDQSLKPANKTLFPNFKFGLNVLIGKDCSIGDNTEIGSNTIIEKKLL